MSRKVFLVTGAASGIGAALAKRILAAGDALIACDIQADGLAALKAQAGARPLLTLTLDVRDAAAWQQAVQAGVAAFGRLDVLCNVAGVLKENWVADATAKEVDWHFDVNVKGVIFGMQAALPTMLAQGAGHIVNIASLAALAPIPGIGLYSASKYAVRGYSLAAAMELAPKGIAVTAVCPDAVQTPMLDIQLDKAQTALTFSGPRALKADEVADAILGPVLRNKPMEIALPGWRGGTAKLVNVFPELGNRVLDRFKKGGAARQQAIGRGKASTER